MSNAHECGIVGCQACGTAHSPDETHCRTCTSRLHPVDVEGLQRVWAWLITSVIFYIPANTIPLLTNRILNNEQGHTILEGVIIFFKHGDIFVAAVILIASLLIPILKMLAIAYIALSIQFNWQIAAIPRGMLYKAVEAIGRWSMIDVFVVVLLVALIQLGAIVTIIPGIGVICFLFSVIFAMFSANSIDSRLIWAHGHT